jgi:small subunit ribosomal protein S21
MSKKKTNVAVLVSGGSIDRSLRQLKKKIEREGVVRDMKRVVYFEPPAQKRRKRLIRAVKQNYLKMVASGLV